ncbi:hypothetical protein FOZ63_002136 [Perkinsus olseni]|uniref:Phosphoglycerate mutase n=1 Tax=Perkinsus olseni TaxID=32597 RepID=A0A7J6UJV1_PEROL|nr:hypothetical protein FOZ63_002136 [Perkinsus olseni]
MRIVFIRHAQSYNNQLWQEVLANHQGKAQPAERHYDQIRSIDPGISDVGKQQAEALARTIRHIVLTPAPPIHAAPGEVSRALHEGERAASRVMLASSPMRRALETAQPLLNALAEGVDGIDFKGAFVQPQFYEFGGCFAPNPSPELPSDGEGRGCSMEGLAGAAFVGLSGMTAGEIREEFGSEWQCSGSMEDGWYDPAQGRETLQQMLGRARKVVEWIYKMAASRDVDTLLVVTHQDFGCLVLRMLLNADHPQWLFNTSTTALEVTASFAPRVSSSMSTVDPGDQYQGASSYAALRKMAARTAAATTTTNAAAGGEASNTETSTESEDKATAEGGGGRKRTSGRRPYRTACLLWANSFNLLGSATA